MATDGGIYALPVNNVMYGICCNKTLMEELRAGLTGKLCKGPINAEVATTITLSSTREYATMTMTGAQVKGLAETGFDAAGDGNAYPPYVLVTRGGCAARPASAGAER